MQKRSYLWGLALALVVISSFVLAQGSQSISRYIRGVTGSFSGGITSGTAMSSPLFDGGAFQGTTGSFSGAVVSGTAMSSPDFDGGTFHGSTMDLTGTLGVGGDVTSGGTFSGGFDGGVGRFGAAYITGTLGLGGRATFGGALWALEVDAGTINAGSANVTNALSAGGDIGSGGLISGILDAGSARIGDLNVGDNGITVSGTVIGDSDLRTKTNVAIDRQLRLFPNTNGAFDNGYSYFEMSSDGTGTVGVVPWGVWSFTVGTEDAGTFSFAGGNVGISGTTIHGGEAWMPALDAGAIAAADIYASGGMVAGGSSTALSYDATAGLGVEAYGIQPGAYFSSGAYALWDWNQDAGYIDFIQPVHLLGVTSFDGAATFGGIVSLAGVDGGSLVGTTLNTSGNAVLGGTCDVSSTLGVSGAATFGLPVSAPAFDGGSVVATTINTSGAAVIGGGVTVGSGGGVVFAGKCDSIGTPGNATCNQAAGRAAIPAAGAAIQIDNSLVSATSIVHATLQYNDATCLYVQSVLPDAGSFVITAGGAACTANNPVVWMVVN